MAQRYDRLQIEINEPILSIVTAIQNDTNSRYLDVSLYDGGVPIPLTGNTVRIHTKNIHGVTSFEQGEITDADNGRCQFLLTTQMLSAADALETQISIWSGDQQVLSTQKFQIYVMPTLRDDTAVESTNEYGALVVLFSEIQNALDDMHAIRENFGEPSEESIQAGTDTFWKVIEKLVADVQTAVAYDLPEKVGDPDDTADEETLFGKVKLNKELIEANIGGVKIFDTAGSFSFVVPPHVTRIKVTAAGGGGGGGYNTGAGGGGGGGGSCIYKRPFTVTPGETISITIGAGGVAAGTSGSGSSNVGLAGGTTVIGNLISLPGGEGGWYSNGGSGGFGGGGGGCGWGENCKPGSGYIPGSTPTFEYSDGAYIFRGSSGGGGFAGGSGGSYGRYETYNSNNAGGGGGGSYGNGGNGAFKSGSSSSSPAAAATPGTYGGGGGGSSSNGNRSESGSSGGSGICIIEW